MQRAFLVPLGPLQRQVRQMRLGSMRDRLGDGGGYFHFLVPFLGSSPCGPFVVVRTPARPSDETVLAFLFVICPDSRQAITADRAANARGVRALRSGTRTDRELTRLQARWFSDVLDGIGTLRWEMSPGLEASGAVGRSLASLGSAQ